MAEPDRFAPLMATVAAALLGEPNARLSNGTEKRYGRNGSLSIDLTRGTWFDHENNEGGGTLSLAARQLGSESKAITWLEENAGLPKREQINGNHPPAGKIVQTYDYTDERGELLFQVCRYEPKTFKQRVRDGNSWSWSTKGVRLVPYRLPDVLEAIANERTIFIVEGEKAVDALWALNIPATCSARGAGKWTENLSPIFDGADVVILPDNDEPGRKHRDLVGEQLKDRAKVRVLDLPGLPDKGDVYDWLKAGGDADAFWRLVEGKARPFGEPDGLHATPFDPRDVAALTARQWVYAHLGIRKFVSAIGSPGGVGKTAYTVGMALSVATGRALLGEAVHESGPVWLFNLEDGRDEMLRRVAAAMQHHHVEPEDIAGNLFIDSGREQPLVIAERDKDRVIATPRYAEMRKEMARVRPAMLIVDPFVNSHALEENRNEQVNFAVRLWAQLAEEFNCSIVLVHHFAKGGVNGEAASFRGASALIDGTRSALALSTMTREEADSFGIEEANRFRMVRVDNAKLNLAPRPDKAMWIELASVRLHTGDFVQAATSFTAPKIFAGLTVDDCNAILDVFDAGLRGEPWSPYKQARQRWAGKAIMDYGAEQGREVSEEKADLILKAWLKSGAVEERSYTSSDRKERTGLYVVDSKRPGRAPE